VFHCGRLLSRGLLFDGKTAEVFLDSGKKHMRLSLSLFIKEEGAKDQGGASRGVTKKTIKVVVLSVGLFV